MKNIIKFKMKVKQNSFNKYSNLSKRPSSFVKFKNYSKIPSSLKSNSKLYNHYHSPDKENEILLIRQKFLNNKKSKLHPSYFTFLTPINFYNLKKKGEISSNQSAKNNLILTSIDNSSLIKTKDKIFPYDTKTKKSIYNNNKKCDLKNIKYNNISLANILLANKRKKTKKKLKRITPDQNNNKSYNYKKNSKLNTEKRNNKKTKNYFTSSLRSRKNSRGYSDVSKEREKGRENLMKKLHILDFKKLIKPYSNIVHSECFTFKGSSRHYGYGLTWGDGSYNSNRKNNKKYVFNNNKNKYGINHFMDYLRGAKIFKYNKKGNKSLSISSLRKVSYKKIINNNSNINNFSSVNRIKSPGNLSCTAPTNVSNNSKLYKNSMIYSIKNISFVPNKKNKKINSKEHKKTKSINIGPMSYPCFKMEIIIIIALVIII